MALTRAGLNYHALSVDVEDWFHILQNDEGKQSENWDELESRVSTNTKTILDILDQHQTKATFFALGWVAEKHPEILMMIIDRGHEVGSHGYSHKIASEMRPSEFAKDLDKSLESIYRATKKNVISFRAPGFSVGYFNFWIFEILKSRGIQIDSSLFLGPHAHGGIDLDRNRPFEVILPSGEKIVEFPIISFELLGQKIPFSGGGYLRLMPTIFAKNMFGFCQYRNQFTVMYVHPRDFDAAQPRLKLSPVRRFKYYVGLNKFSDKFENILTSFKFGSLSKSLENLVLDKPLFLKENRLEVRSISRMVTAE
ncbi:MAG: polysaccharide deacetylase family protein [Nodosilinea sp.]